MTCGIAHNAYWNDIQSEVTMFVLSLGGEAQSAGENTPCDT
jgi:hypothetical protein